jgi:hypothetical protein
MVLAEYLKDYYLSVKSGIMENDTKDLLMQYLYRVTEHYGINTAVPVTFRKRGELLDALRQHDQEAWTVITALIDAFIKEDRITNDKEKFDKARVLWESERAAAEKEKVHAEMLLIKFCKDHSIPVGRVSQDIS